MSEYSVTRLGEIFPLGQNSLKVLGHFLSNYVVFGKIVNPLAKYVKLLGKISFLKWPNFYKNNTAIWSH